MAAVHFFTAARNGGALTQQQAERTSTLGTINLLSESGAANVSSASADNLIYSVLAACATAYASGWTRKATAYLAATGATANVTVTTSPSSQPGGFGLTAAGLVVQDFDGFANAVLRASGYEGVSLSRRRVALASGTSW